MKKISFCFCSLPYGMKKASSSPSEHNKMERNSFLPIHLKGTRWKGRGKKKKDETEKNCFLKPSEIYT